MQKFDLSNRVYNLVIIFLIGALVYGGFRIYEIYQNANGYYPREISVEADGSAFVVPDVAVVSVGVYAEGEESEKVIAEGTEKMNAVIDAVKEKGVAEEDIKTTNYYFSPRYQWTEERGSFTDGYTLDQSISVKIRDLEKIGEILGAADDVGANNIGGVNFEVDDPENAFAEAREEAIEKAKKKAEEIADQSGLRLGRVVNFWEYDNYYDDYYYDTGYRSLDYAYEESIAIEPYIEPGQEEVSLTVSLTFRVY